ncbi:hypothetical protein Agub_g755, partial [Astrephomene gubernaculifera]
MQLAQHKSCRWAGGPLGVVAGLCRTRHAHGNASRLPRTASRARLSASNASVQTAATPLTAMQCEKPPEVDFTDVNRHNFAAVLPIMRAAIQDATFIAIDTEFTGLTAESVYDFLDDFEERYKRMQASSASFVICQFGLTAFKWHPGPAGGRNGHWEARTFNAYVFPRPDENTGLDKRFLCQASSLAYLASQGFDFNKMILEGIGYSPLGPRLAALQAEAAKQNRGMRLRQPWEEELVSGARQAVRSWLLGAEAGAGTEEQPAELRLPLPPSPRGRQLLRQLLQLEFQPPSLGYPPFSVEEVATSTAEGEGSGSAGGSSKASGSSSGGIGEEGDAGGEAESEDAEEEHAGSGGRKAAALPEGFLRLQREGQWRVGELAGAGLELSASQRMEAAREQSGFSQVLEALREAGRPVVGHNPAYDLAYMLAQFSEPLPPTWTDYKALLQRTFPGGLYDTKHVAQQLAAQYGLPLADTSLGALYRALMDEQWLRANVPGMGLMGAGAGATGGGSSSSSRSGAGG